MPHCRPRSLVRFVAAVAITLGAVSSPSIVDAQSTSWTSAHQAASWYATFVDHAISSRNAIWFDGQWRRMGLVDAPQQLLLRGGLQHTLTPGVRVAGGYAWIATAPYGEVPTATAFREHRAWQQLLLTHRAGPATVIHRYRLEQRWLSTRAADGTGGSIDGRWQYQNRVRYQVRAQGNIPALSINTRPLLGFVYDELLLPFGHGDATLRAAQNRLGGGVGLPVSARQRIELGYMNLWNALPARRTNEINHTFTLSWVWIATR